MLSAETSALFRSNSTRLQRSIQFCLISKCVAYNKLDKCTSCCLSGHPSSELWIKVSSHRFVAVSAVLSALKPPPGSSSDSCTVPACVAPCREEGSATSVLLEQPTLSTERGHLSPPPASSRLSLENSARGAGRSRGWDEERQHAAAAGIKLNFKNPALQK